MVLKTRIKAIENNVNRREYYRAIEELNDIDVFSKNWNEAFEDVKWIMLKAIDNGDDHLVTDIANDLYPMEENDIYDDEFHENLVMLKKCGYDYYVQKITGGWDAHRERMIQEGWGYFYENCN